MKSRQEIKAQGKRSFLDLYGRSIGVYVLYLVIVAAVSSITFGLGALFVGLHLMIGLAFYSVELYRGKQPSLECMFDVGFRKYGRNLGGMLWMELWVFLWSLLLVVPGIIKYFSYAMTPYILADLPDVSATDALKLSKRIMHGHKWEYFVLGLSYIGWMLLSGITFGILNFLYVGPYMQTSFGGYYHELMQHSLDQGIVRPEELSGAPVA